MNDTLDDSRPEEEARVAALTLEEALASGLQLTPGMLLTLYDLWIQGEDPDSAERYLLDLAGAIQEDSGLSMAPGVRDILAAHPAAKPRLTQELERLDELIRSNRRQLLLASVSLEERRIQKFDLPREIMLAQRLHKAKIIPSSDFFAVLKDLCGFTPGGMAKPSTVLHAVHDQQMSCEPRIMEYLVKHAGLPYINLACFALRLEAAFSLHVEFMKYRAALVFETIGPDALVAILNPFNMKLRQDVALVTQCNCHFFLVSAEEYDKALVTVLQKANEAVVNLDQD